MVFWVPQVLPILSPDLLDAHTHRRSLMEWLSLWERELQDQLGRQVGGASRSPSPGWGSEPVLGVCGNCPAPVMTAGCQGVVPQLCSQTTEENLETIDP